MKIPSPIVRRRARIEIIPLIDIIFFLLATFVMVSMAMIKNRGIPLQLPKAATSSPQDRKDSFSISINAAGELFFEKEKVSADELVARLDQITKRLTDPRIFINGDEQADFGKAIEVLDLVRKAGISKVAIETRPKELKASSKGADPSTPNRTAPL